MKLWLIVSYEFGTYHNRLKKSYDSTYHKLQLNESDDIKLCWDFRNGITGSNNKYWIVIFHGNFFLLFIISMTFLCCVYGIWMFVPYTCTMLSAMLLVTTTFQIDSIYFHVFAAFILNLSLACDPVCIVCSATLRHRIHAMKMKLHLIISIIHHLTSCANKLRSHM